MEKQHVTMKISTRSCMGVQGKPSDAVLQRGIGFDNVKLVVVINSN
jgi:hypothetical protein